MRSLNINKKLASMKLKRSALRKLCNSCKNINAVNNGYDDVFTCGIDRYKPALIYKEAIDNDKEIKCDAYKEK